jgi:hypothetical protein
MEHDRTLSAKARGQHMRSGQKLLRVFDPLFGGKRLEGLIDFLQLALVGWLATSCQPSSEREIQGHAPNDKPGGALRSPRKDNDSPLSRRTLSLGVDELITNA